MYAPPRQQLVVDSSENYYQLLITSLSFYIFTATFPSLLTTYEAENNYSETFFSVVLLSGIGTGHR